MVKEEYMLFSENSSKKKEMLYFFISDPQLMGKVKKYELQYKTK